MGDVSLPGMATFGARLRAVRNATRPRISQETLGKAIGHARPSTVQGWERGKLPKPENIVALATALRVSAEDLLSGVVTEYDALRGFTEELLLALEGPHIRRLAILAAKLPAPDALALIDQVAQTAAVHKPGPRGGRSLAPTADTTPVANTTPRRARRR